MKINWSVVFISGAFFTMFPIQASASIAEHCFSNGRDCLDGKLPARVSTAKAKFAQFGIETKGKDKSFLYATQRKRNAAYDGHDFRAVSDFYLNERSEEGMRFGRVTVTTPREAFSPGEKFVSARGDQGGFVAIDPQELTVKEFLEEVAAKSKGQPKPLSVLAYVHGINNSFGSAAVTTAQLYTDIGYRGLGFFVSWPSIPALIPQYVADMRTLLTVQSSINVLLKAASQVQSLRLQILAHSRGTEAVCIALKKLPDDGRLIDDVVLFASDLEVDTFRRNCEAELALKSELATIYVNRLDQVLEASKALARRQKVGLDVRQYASGIDTISVYGAFRTSLGHSYYYNSPDVLRDLQQLLIEDQTAVERSCDKEESGETGVFGLRLWSVSRRARRQRERQSRTDCLTVKLSR